MIGHHPDLFEALIRETRWNTVSVGFESGSDRVLETLNKECREEDNRFAISFLNDIGDEMEREGKKPPTVWANVILGTPGETREDAEKTLRMLHSTRRVQPSVSFFTPYPGSLLGYQLIAEGKSLLLKDTYHRNPGIAKVRDIDYAFFKSVLSRMNVPPSRVMTDTRSPVMENPVHDRLPRSQVYLFSMKNGKKKIAYGITPKQALEILAYRLSKEEMDEIEKDQYIVVASGEIMGFIHELG